MEESVKRIITSIVLMLLIAVCGIAQEKRAMTLDNLFSFDRVGMPALSPDGKLVAYTVTEIYLDKNSGKTDIYVIPIEGGEPLKLTNAKASSHSPVWSPDGETIAFERGGQIWLISINGGEAHKLTDIPSGATGIKWSPDGKSIAFTSFVWPNCDAECAEEREKAEKESSVTAKTTESLLFRHWDTWRTDGKRSHLFLVDVATGEYHDLIPDAEYDVPPFPFGGSGDYNFSPDGLEIAFTAKVAPDPAIQTNLDIHILSLEGGEPKNITAEYKGQDAGPVYSPDGKYIAYLSMKRPRFEADQQEITLYERQTGGIRKVTEAFDRNITEFVWLPDGSGFIAGADHHGRHPAFLVPLEGEVKEIVGNGTLFGIDITPEAKQLVYNYRSLRQPPTICVADMNGESRELITNNHEMLSQLDLGEVEDLWFDGANGDKVQVYLVKPPNFDPSKKWPLLHIIHGGPQQNYADLWTFGWNSQAFAAKGYVVALVCFHATPGYGQAFTDAVTHNWGGTPYEDIMKGTDFLISLGYIDENRMAAGGGSYGGYMANWIATQTDRFDCLISHAGLFNLESMYGATEELWFPEWELNGPYWEDDTLYTKWSPHKYAKNLKTPMLVSAGQQDFRVPVTQSLELFTALQRQGVPSKLIYYPDENHWILQQQNNYFWYSEFIKWLERWVK